MSLHYDDIDTRADGTELSRKGVSAVSFRTKNIANIVTLERPGKPGEGFIVTTTRSGTHRQFNSIDRTSTRIALTF